MKILIVDQDDLATQLVKSKLQPLGHEVESEPDKKNVVERLEAGDFDLVFIDPAPLTSARPLILNIRRSAGRYSYVILMSEETTQEEAMKAGANDLLKKPLDASVLEEKITNAERLVELTARIGDDSEDFPSAGGVIAKSAFNQLFLSGIDRADRYGEQTFVLFISLNNYEEILKREGAYAAGYVVAKLSQHLVNLRRQSDIIAQTGQYEHALLLQRPIYETEPVEAANRFAESLQECTDIASEGFTPAEIAVRLIDLPIGSHIVEHIITHDPGKEQAAEA